MPHLLVIDNEAPIRRVIARLLGRDFMVTDAGDAETAIVMLDESTRFDVVLCDLTLPRMSAYDLYDDLRCRSHPLAARFVIMTGWDAAADDAFAAMLGERYIMKPFSFPEVVATLRKVAFPRLSTPACAPGR